MFLTKPPLKGDWEFGHGEAKIDAPVPMSDLG